MDIKQVAAEVRRKLKEEYPACRWAVNIDRFSLGQELRVKLLSAPFPVTRDGRQKSQLNPVIIRQAGEDWDWNCNGAELTPDGWKLLQRADQIANEHNSRDKHIWNEETCSYFFSLHLNIR